MTHPTPASLSNTADFVLRLGVAELQHKNCYNYDNESNCIGTEVRLRKFRAATKEISLLLNNKRGFYTCFRINRSAAT